ncbi:MAG: family 1 glycosylhydrolase [Candidatus Hydrogenedentes bacterium]|nr:family 1 glycosylhydrolase [Candidatus Hydrogenedentota bacterium]
MGDIGRADDTVVENQNNVLWGATVNAHAVEGADFNADWWRWEQRPAHIQGAATSEVAADHLSRYKTDLGLAQKIGLNTLQYGISWARIEPEKGQFDEVALLHYEGVFREMRERGINPICVFQEHSLPAWFSHQGAWAHPEAPDLFLVFVTRVYEAFGIHCDYWLPHFEPLLWLGMAYGEKRWPSPSRRKRRSEALAGLARAHQKAWAFLKTASEANRVGISIYAPRIHPSDAYSPWDERVAEQMTCQLLRSYPDSVVAACGTEKLPSLDGLEVGRTSNTCPNPPLTPPGRGIRPFCFIALSCPGTLGVHGAPLRPRNGFAQFERIPGKPSALDETEPEASSMTLYARQLSRWGVPLLITGIGVASEDDDARCRHLLDHVDAFLRLRDEGLDMMGFCYRALLDGFAWHHGYSQRFGLVHVDRKSLARTPNPSAFLYRDIIKAGAISPGVVSRFASGWKAPLQEMYR